MPIVLDGLRRLEYRGYDSAGIAVLNGSLEVVRSKGKIAALERKTLGLDLHGTCAVGHTRWATHGRPTEENAHPHRSCNGEVAVVHNGIVENYAALKRDLEAFGHVFTSDTDTEVLAHLVEEAYAGDLEAAVKRAMSRVRGTFGAVFMHRDEPDKLVAARRGAPLVIGVGEGEHFIASDVSAFVRDTREVVHLEDEDVALITAERVRITTLVSAFPIDRPKERVEWELSAVEKGGFEHFMLKEICEQPDAIRNAMRGRTSLVEGMACLRGLDQVQEALLGRTRLTIVACGTSYHAGLAARTLFDELTEIEVDVELASEFRYRKKSLAPGTVVLAISQSGETADTLAALREAKRQGALILGLVNVVGSSIARLTDGGIYNHAGPEIGVASTKAFTSQVTILTLMAVLLGRRRRLSLDGGRMVIGALLAIPASIERIVARREAIREIAEKYRDVEHFFYLGRRHGFPVALEGALKMKEISYVHAEGYAAGELKHGPIALIDPGYCCIALCPKDEMQEKMISNMQEVRARGARVIVVATEGDDAVLGVADDVIYVPETIDLLTPILETVPLQLFAYYVAAMRGCEIDTPRNLAKSVTVE